MPSEQNYHSSKLEFLALKWVSLNISKNTWLMCCSQCVLTIISDIHADNTQLGCNRTSLGGSLTSYNFTLEYQKGSDNAATDALSRVPVRHSKDTI